jgi:hypothetical protein
MTVRKPKTRSARTRSQPLQPEPNQPRVNPDKAKAKAKAKANAPARAAAEVRRAGHIAEQVRRAAGPLDFGGAGLAETRQRLMRPAARAPARIGATPPSRSAG